MCGYLCGKLNLYAIFDMFACYRQAKNRFNPETNVAHLCRVLEDTISVMERRKARLAAPAAASQIPRKPEGDVQTGSDGPLADRIRDGR